MVVWIKLWMVSLSDKERYDLILVDEAHKFRNHRSQQFQNLQIICKSGRENIGNVLKALKKSSINFCNTIKQ
jgi:hypothetical protein